MPYTENMDKVSFLQNAMVQDAVIRNIEIIGEAACNIEKHDPEFAEQYPDVLWKDADLMRNRESHGYSLLIWKSSGKQCSMKGLNSTLDCADQQILYHHLHLRMQTGMGAHNMRIICSKCRGGQRLIVKRRHHRMGKQMKMRERILL